MKHLPLVLLAVLLGLGALMLYRMPVQRYVVTCERTGQVSCLLERSTSAGTERRTVQLGAEASAVVRLMPQRRGAPRVLLYLESPGRSAFAAELEGADAASAAESAAARLNEGLRSGNPVATRIEIVAPPTYRRMGWAGLGVMGLLIVAMLRDARRRAPVGPDGDSTTARAPS